MNVKTYPAMNSTIKDLLRNSEEPMQQYALARIEELEQQVEAYKATGMTPEEIGALIGTMRGTCALCLADHDPETAPKVNGCQYTDCSVHKWRAKWYKEEAET